MFKEFISCLHLLTKAEFADVMQLSYLQGSSARSNALQIWFWEFEGDIASCELLVDSGEGVNLEEKESND